MSFVFSRLIFSPTCALCSSSLVVISWHTFSSSASIAMSSAKSRSVKRFYFCQTMPYSGLSMVLRMTKSMTMMKRNGERMHPCRTPETIWVRFVLNSENNSLMVTIIFICLETVNECDLFYEEKYFLHVVIWSGLEPWLFIVEPENALVCMCCDKFIQDIKTLKSS